jgi:hypothetical protein
MGVRDFIDRDTGPGTGFASGQPDIITRPIYYPSGIYASGILQEIREL